MKVFKFWHGQTYWGYAAETKEEAKEAFFEEQGEMELDRISEIPESKWDKKIISMYEDNDIEKDHWKISIREAIVGNSPQQIFTNDTDSF